jgi:hypothetical protein
MRPTDVIGRRVLLATVVGVAAFASSCGRTGSPVLSGEQSPSTPCPSSFAVSLVSDQGGEATPTAAAIWFAQHGGASVPLTGLA